MLIIFAFWFILGLLQLFLWNFRFSTLFLTNSFTLLVSRNLSFWSFSNFILVDRLHFLFLARFASIFLNAVHFALFHAHALDVIPNGTIVAADHQSGIVTKILFELNCCLNKPGVANTVFLLRFGLLLASANFTRIAAASDHLKFCPLDFVNLFKLVKLIIIFFINARWSVDHLKKKLSNIIHVSWTNMHCSENI